MLASPNAKDEIQQLSLDFNRKTIFISRKIEDKFDQKLVSNTSPFSKFINVEHEKKAFTIYSENPANCQTLSEGHLNLLLKKLYPNADPSKVKRVKSLISTNRNYLNETIFITFGKFDA